MGVEVRPMGVQCNIACQYCYQNVLRDAGWRTERTDVAAIKKTVLEVGQSFHVFGGEPLLTPLDQLEELFRFGLEQFNQNGIQTNGTLITDDHVELFQKYEVSVGISIDGPEALNDSRWAGTLQRTREMTRLTENAIQQLCEAGLPPALMVQLTRCNAVGERLEQLCSWLREMDDLGVHQARIHILEVDNEALRERHALSAEENYRAFVRMGELGLSLRNLKLDCNHDKQQMLMMQDEDVACVWRGCDPLSTEAVLGVGSDGELHKCGLTDKEGINFLRPAEQGYERYISLYFTPQQYGGCQGCRFFVTCKGQCPGTGIDGDWRNRSENCEVWKMLFAQAEGILLASGRTPVSVHPARAEVESRMVDAWAQGRNPPLSEIRGELQLALGKPVEDWV